MESNMSKFPDSSTQNIDQVNLLVEFIGENNSNKNDNFSHACQNISNELLFDSEWFWKPLTLKHQIIEN